MVYKYNDCLVIGNTPASAVAVFDICYVRIKALGFSLV